MSKERARQRAARTHEAALRAAARAAEVERRERRAVHTARLRRGTVGRLPGRARPGRAGGSLAARRRSRTSVVLAVLAALNVLVWAVRPDAAARLGVLVVSLLAAPVLVTLLVPRGR